MSSLLAVDPVFFRLRGPVLPPGEEARKMLGRIVRNYAQPLGGGYAPEDASPFAIGSPAETKWQRAADVFVRSASGDIELRLGGVGGARGTLDSTHVSAMANSEVLAMELRHQPEVYRRMLADKEVGTWISGNCAVNQPLFMVTGLLVWRDAVQRESSARGVGGGVSATIPVGSVAAAAATSGAGAALPGPGPLGDVQAAAGGQSFQARSQERESGDSQIFAVEYKVIRKRKRDVLGGFAPVFRDESPSVDTDRQYSSGPDTAPAPAPGEDDAPVIEPDLPWLDVAEELDQTSELHTEGVHVEGAFIEFVSI